MQKLLSMTALFVLLGLVACQKETLNLSTNELATTEFASTDRGENPGLRNPAGFPPDTMPAGEQITFDQLPTDAQAWLTANVDVDKIEKILKITRPDGTVAYVVVMENHRKIRFDADGALLQPNGPGGGNGGSGNGGPANPPTQITFNDLPANAQAWLLANTDTSKIRTIVQITGPNGEVGYGVIFEGKRRVRFDAEGNLLAGPHGPGNGGPGNGGPGNGGPGNGGAACAGTAPVSITVAELPQPAQDWLASNAAGATIQGVRKITRPDCEVYYIVKIEGQQPVRFDANGNKI